LKESLDAHAQSSLDEIGTAVFADIALHQREAEQYDDMTLLAVEVK
jgi:serine phosphatase RsbU (regulator of sigma subunit)